MKEVIILSIFLFTIQSFQVCEAPPSPESAHVAHVSVSRTGGKKSLFYLFFYFTIQSFQVCEKQAPESAHVCRLLG